MTRTEFYSRVALNLKNAGYYTKVVKNDLLVYGYDERIAVNFKRNIVTIDGHETNWNHHFIDNMVVLSCSDIIDKVFPLVDIKDNDSDSHDVAALNAEYKRNKFRVLTQSEFTYCLGYLTAKAALDDDGSSYYPYAYDMESNDIVTRFDSDFDYSDRLFMKVSALHD